MCLIKIMNVTTYVLIIFCVPLLLHAYTPVGYIGCYKDWRTRVLQGKCYFSASNTGDDCKRFCMSEGYRYAGTESEDECFCGHDFRRKEKGHSCDHPCSGNKWEICGGYWRLSVYDTWQCVTIPCRHGGHCVDTDAHTYTCECTDGWTGSKCETEKTTTTLPKTTTTTTTTSTTTTRLPTTSKSTPSKTNDITDDFPSTRLSSIIRPFNATQQLGLVEDDDDVSLVAVYVLLPLIGILLLITSIFFLRRRRRLKKETPEVIYHGPGSMPNIYANITIASDNNTGFEKIPIKAVQHSREADNDNTEEHKAAIDDTPHYYVNTRDYVNGMVDYNRHGQVKSSYNHISVLSKFATDNTYSKLSNTKHFPIQSTYSNFKSCGKQREENKNIGDEDGVYNKLDVKGNLRLDSGIKNTDRLSSEYDHAGIRPSYQQSLGGDIYSHLNNGVGHTHNDKCEYSDCNYAEQIAHVDEDEYATVVK